MENGLSDLEKVIIRELTGDLPATAQPFAPIARQLGISQKHLLQIIKKLKDEGFIRRFGATIRHRNSGFSANAMVVWRIPEGKIDEVGRTMASYREVTHCYHRRPQGNWKYNLFTMIHGASEEKCRQIIKKISRATAMNDYQLLFSRKELKKTTMRYFNE
ncbi:MAG: Lrp/AsnC family transcriptional regulator [Thermodesulfobacteriota bacterium]|jgi:DNA-binding Lrp family transcriptional regulator